MASFEANCPSHGAGYPGWQPGSVAGGRELSAGRPRAVRSFPNVLPAQILRSTADDGARKEEDVSFEARFDIPLLAERLMAATQWLRAQPSSTDLNVGYFGASTGAAAALQAAATLGSVIKAVVSRGERPDLAWAALASVQAPTLHIVGGRDDVVIELNQRAYAQLNAEKQLVIIPGTTHLFEEPGALSQVARLAAAWFSRYLQPRQAADR
jgi:putative phosphoribosyl transferase